MCDRCCKIKTYINFAKKSRNIIFGVEHIIRCIKKCKLIIVSNALADSSFAKLNIAIKKFNIDITRLDENIFRQKIDSETIKAIAITDKSLSDAIKKELD